MTRVPSPSALSSVSSPPCASMMRWTIGNPSPVPLGRDAGVVARLFVAAAGVNPVVVGGMVVGELMGLVEAFYKMPR